MMRDIEWQVQLEGHQFSPGTTANFTFRYKNKNRYHHEISKVLIHTSLDNQHVKDVEIEVAPMGEVQLPPFQVKLPEGLGGNHYIKFGVEVVGYNKYTNKQSDCERIWTEEPLFWNLVYPTFRAFVSRSNRPKDVEISDSIQNQIRDWGFETDTLFTDVEQPSQCIAEKMEQADCLFGIAVPRYETIEGEHPQFHYLDGETGMALNRGIPVVIFEHKDVDLKGLPNECLRIQFEDPESTEFKRSLDSVMLQVRQAIKQNRQQEFRQKVLKIGGAMAVGAILSGSLGSEPETGSEDQEE